MTLAQWSTTAANNASGVTGINWAEGMPPSAVNNSSRQEMADVANWYRNTAEFIDRDDSAAFSSATKIKFTGTDLTGTYKVGRRIFTTSSTPGTLHGRITASSFSTDTTVTIDFDNSTAVLSNEAISDVQVGIVSGSTNSAVHIAAIAGMPAFTASKRGAILLQNGDDDGYALQTSQGSSGQFFKSNGADADPSFQTALGDRVLLQTTVATTSATVDFTTSINSTFKKYQFDLINVRPSAAAELHMRVREVGSTTFKSGASDYSWASSRTNGASGTVTETDTADAQINITGNVNMISTGTKGANFTIYLNDPASTASHTSFEGTGGITNTGAQKQIHTTSGDYVGSAVAIDAVQFLSSESTGTIAGTFKLTGLK